MISRKTTGLYRKISVIRALPRGHFRARQLLRVVWWDDCNCGKKRRGRWLELPAGIPPAASGG
ncbi:MAG: hypothetical protein ACO1SX_29460, partial [Actinomycetota bacterium]